MANEIKSELRGAVLVVSFNRPDQANAMTLDLATQLFNVLKPVTTDRGIRAVLLQGMGGNFMDGLDLGFYSVDYNRALEQANQINLPYHSAIRELQVMEKPVLAAVTGMTAGPGLSFMLACDLVMAARSAKFNCRFTSYAAPPDGGCSLLLARKAGITKACELLMLNDTFGADEAMSFNLVNWIVDDDKLQAEALAMAERLASGPTRAYGNVKKLVMKGFEQDINAQLGLEHTMWGGSTRTFDYREAIRAHFAKRPPKFTGA